MVRTPTFDAPGELGSIRFYTTQLPERERSPGVRPRPGVQKLVGLTNEGEVVACLVLPMPEEGVPLSACRQFASLAAPLSSAAGSSAARLTRLPASSRDGGDECAKGRGCLCQRFPRVEADRVFDLTRAPAEDQMASVHRLNRRGKHQLSLDFSEPTTAEGDCFRPSVRG